MLRVGYCYRYREEFYSSGVEGVSRRLCLVFFIVEGLGGFFGYFVGSRCYLYFRGCRVVGDLCASF